MIPGDNQSRRATNMALVDEYYRLASPARKAEVAYFAQLQRSVDQNGRAPPYMGCDRDTEWFTSTRRLVMDDDDSHGLAMIAHLHELPEATIQASKARERIRAGRKMQRAKGAAASMRAIASLQPHQRQSKTWQ
jgi:hypothetical protein